MNLREQAMREIATEIINMNPMQAEGFLMNVLKGVPDMTIFAMYYQYFGHAVGEAPSGHTEPEETCDACQPEVRP